jgi:hypothetical protein
VDSRDVAREVGDLRVVGDRIAAKILESQLPFGPEHVEGVLEKVLLFDEAIQGFEKLGRRHRHFFYLRHTASLRGGT